MTILPGLVLSLLLALGGQYLSQLIGVTWMGMPQSPVSGIMMAILLGMLVRNTIGLNTRFLPGVQFGLKRVLKLGIVLLGIRLSRRSRVVRNLGMLVIIPLMGIVYHRNSGETGVVVSWWKMVPLFVIGFAMMSLVRTVGEMGDSAFGIIPPVQWQTVVGWVKEAAAICLAVAMASVGLGTYIRDLVSIGWKPLAMGLIAALLVGGVSVSLIALLY